MATNGQSESIGAPADPEAILQNLDDEQAAAASSILGPTVILAGAGTGKTRTITHRIAYGLARGFYATNRILALTYTNRAAAELRHRLHSLGIAGVSVKTFHAAALAQLDYFWPQFAGVPAPQLLGSKAAALARAAETQKIFLDAAATRELAAEIEWRKVSLLSIEEYSELLPDRPPIAGLGSSQNIALQTSYEEQKRAAARIDWEDALLLCLGLLRSEPRALAHVQQQYRFFTVDEYQDISPLQHALLDEWLGNRSDLCVVGDPNQTIYSFTGASAVYLHSFAARFADARVFELSRNYRSTPAIVNTANRLIRAENSLPDLLAARPGAQSVVSAKEFETQAQELDYVGYQIERLLAGGANPEDIAILYRVNGQAAAIESALAERGVAYQLRGGQRFFSRLEIRQAIAALRAAATVADERPTFQILSDICRSLGWNSTQPARNGTEFERWEALGSLLSILEELPPTCSVSELLYELEERQRAQQEPSRRAVTLSTIHAAKGLEWSHVFVVGVVEGYLPISHANGEAEVAEELRLFYVALTRAKDTLTISYARRDIAGRANTPSQFLRRLEA